VVPSFKTAVLAIRYRQGVRSDDRGAKPRAVHAPEFKVMVPGSIELKVVNFSGFSS